MNDVMDKHGQDLMRKAKLTNEESKTLFNLLNKVDPEMMEGGINWFSLNKSREEDIEELKEKFYEYALENFFALYLNGFIVETFGDEVFDLVCGVDPKELKKNLFIKGLKDGCHDLNKVGKIMDII